MSIASEISRIQSAKTDIREAIEAKGVTVPDSEHIDTYPDYISQIQQGGGGASEVPGYLESWAYDDWGRITSATTTAGTGNLGSVFQGNQALKDIVIKGYTVLDDNAFNGCTFLSGVTVPNDVIGFGNRCFERCTSLTGITIPSGVTSLEDSCFQSCTSLTGITIPSGVTSIGYGCFQYCTSLTGITIPSGVTSIGYTCFNGCTSLESITVEATTPPTLEFSEFDNTNDCPIYVPCGTADTYKGASGWSNYASRIFENPSCSDIGNNKITYNLEDGTTGSVECDITERLDNEDISSVLPTMTSCTVGSCAKTVDKAFENAPMLSQVTLSEGIETINGAFNGCTALTSITIPESTTTVGGFKGCTSLASVTLGSNVTDLLTDAFSGCTFLTGITIPSGITSLGESCFAGCTALTEITLPDSLTSIGSYCFNGCSSLASITVEATTPPILGAFAFQGTAESLTIYVPSNSVEQYKTTLRWSDYADKIQAISDIVGPIA